MTSGGNSFNDFPEIVPTNEITTTIKKTSFSRPWPWAYFLNGPNAATQLNPALIMMVMLVPYRYTVSCILGPAGGSV